jgi:hypothetical protein
MTNSESAPDSELDRQAIEHITGRPLPTAWPAEALAPGSRVTVIRDPNWDGPWQHEIPATIGPLGAPEPVNHPHANIAELQYWVRFDTPQYDSSGDGPYRMAQIWGRYLRPSEPPAYVELATGAHRR